MRRLLRIVLWFFLLMIFIVSIAFSLVNNATVPLSFGYFTLAPQPVSVWIIAAFCVGATSGLILGAGFFKDIRARLKVRQLHKEIADLQLKLGKNGVIREGRNEGQ